MNEEIEQQIPFDKQKPYIEIDNQPFITVQFIMIEKNWPFIHFTDSLRKTDPFLIVEDKIKAYHGCLKNLELYCQPSGRKKLQYNFSDSLQSKLQFFNQNQDIKDNKISIYYKYENGYEWPLL